MTLCCTGGCTNQCAVRQLRGKTPKFMKRCLVCIMQHRIEVQSSEKKKKCMAKQQHPESEISNVRPQATENITEF